MTREFIGRLPRDKGERSPITARPPHPVIHPIMSASTVLALQRSFGNAVVSRVLHRDRHDRDERHLELVVQRQADLTKVPSDLTCPVSTGPPPEVGTALIFANGGTTVDADLTKVIHDFVRIWKNVRSERGGDGADLVVDGYGSTTGSQKLNWRLSCGRAETVRDVLIAEGVPAGKIRVFAHGETNIFDRAPLRNQRAIISPVDPAGFRGTFENPRRASGPDVFPGLGARKRELMSHTGELLDMAVAMLETDTMGPEYPFGDGKEFDAACFGIFKQNWHYIRTSGAMPRLPISRPGPGIPGLEPEDFARGAELNHDRARDVAVLHASQAKLGRDRWFAAHREGESGELAFLAAAKGRTTGQQRALLSDIANYQQAVEWIRDQLVRDPTLQTDDRKVFVQVPAV